MGFSTFRCAQVNFLELEGDVDLIGVDAFHLTGDGSAAVSEKV